MNFIIFLVSLGLISAVCSNPISKCPAHCEETDQLQQTDFRHVSDLQDSSAAPWKLDIDSKDGREPCHIQKAVCQGGCTMLDMVPKPIIVEISVYQMLHESSHWCKCPYELAVGCTCVNKTATE